MQRPAAKLPSVTAEWYACMAFCLLVKFPNLVFNMFRFLLFGLVSTGFTRRRPEGRFDLLVLSFHQFINLRIVVDVDVVLPFCAFVPSVNAIHHLYNGVKIKAADITCCI